MKAKLYVFTLNRYTVFVIKMILYYYVLLNKEKISRRLHIIYNIVINYYLGNVGKKKWSMRNCFVIY